MNYAKRNKQSISKKLKILALAMGLFVGSGCASMLQNYPINLGQKINTCKQEKLEERIKKQIKNSVAILLIDMQDYFLKGIDPAEKEKEIPYQIEVLDYCKKNEIPVFILEYKDYGSTTSILREKLNELTDKTYIIKLNENGFIDTDLADRLNQKGVKNLLLMGINASACVLNTAKGALESGYTIMVSKDLIADRPPSNQWQFYWDFNESIDWYKKNGIYQDNYKDLLKIISEETIKKEI